MHALSFIAKRPRSAVGRFAAAVALGLAMAADSASGREFATDRPDITESPLSVPDGRWQLECDVISATDADRGSQWSGGIAELMVFNLKRGFGTRTDVQLVVRPAALERAPRPQGVRGSWRSAGATTAVRVKRNLLDPEGERWALAMLPWIEWREGGAVAGARHAWGVAVPLGGELPGELGAGVMVEWASEPGDEHRSNLWGLSATLGRDVAGPLAVFVEGVMSGEARRASQPGLLFSSGLTIAVHPDVRLDAGLRLGAVRERSASGFVGFAVRR